MQSAQTEKKKQQSQTNFTMKINQQGKKLYIFKNFETYPWVIQPDYSLNTIKGFGTYSIVCLGKNQITNQPIAIKRIHRIFQDLGDAKRILRQIKILKFLKHRNIVSIKDILKIDNPQTFNEVYLCLQYMEYTLKKLILSPQTSITDEMIQFILYQTLNAIYFMHSADITHRDLKPENILITKKLQLKITDMNLAKKQIADDDKTYYVTSRPYRAPEVFINPNAYTKAIDIWSVGCIFAELLGKTVIFGGIDFVDQIKQFIAILGKPKLDIFTNLDPTTAQGLARVFRDIPDREKVEWKFLFPKASEKALDLLDRMLVYDPKLRYTAEQCLNHPYLELYRNRQRQKCHQIFDFSFDKIEMTIPKLRQAIFDEVQLFQQKKSRTSGPLQEQQFLEKKVKTE